MYRVSNFFFFFFFLKYCIIYLYLFRAKVIIRRMLRVNTFELFKSFALLKIDDKLCVFRHVPPSCEGDWERGRFEDEAEQYSESTLSLWIPTLSSSVPESQTLSSSIPESQKSLFFFFFFSFFFFFAWKIINITCNVILWLAIYVMGNISVLSSKWSRANFDNHSVLDFQLPLHLLRTGGTRVRHTFGKLDILRKCLLPSLNKETKYTVLS